MLNFTIFVCANIADHAVIHSPFRCFVGWLWYGKW